MKDNLFVQTMGQVDIACSEVPVFRGWAHG